MMKLSFIALTTTLAFKTAQSKPSDYWKLATPAVLKQRDLIYHMRTQREDKNPDRWEEARLGIYLHPKPLTAETDLNAWCGNSTSGQRQWFTENKCSLADFDMTYSDSAGNIRQAQRGEVVDMHCDGVFCPPPKVPDCYTHPGICAGKLIC